MKLGQVISSKMPKNQTPRYLFWGVWSKSRALCMSPDESATEGVGRRPKLVSNGLGQIQLKKKERKKKKKKQRDIWKEEQLTKCYFLLGHWLHDHSLSMCEKGTTYPRFPGDPVFKNPLVNAGDMGATPNLRKFHRRKATKPAHHNYWACALEPSSCSYWRKRLEPVLHLCFH